jgi:hypothetical protein
MQSILEEIYNHNGYLVGFSACQLLVGDYHDHQVSCFIQGNCSCIKFIKYLKTLGKFIDVRVYKVNKTEWDILLFSMNVIEPIIHVNLKSVFKRNCSEKALDIDNLIANKGKIILPTYGSVLLKNILNRTFTCLNNNPSYEDIMRVFSYLKRGWNIDISRSKWHVTLQSKMEIESCCICKKYFEGACQTPILKQSGVAYHIYCFIDSEFA